MIAAPVSFKEGHVEADGFRIRYLEAGQGDALVVLHGGGGLRLYHSHELLAEKFRVILFEVPGFGQSAANEKSQSMAELGETMARAVHNMGIDRYNLMGNSFGGRLALWLAVQDAEHISAMVLVAPAAIRPENAVPPQARSAEEMSAILYAHPERHAPIPPASPEALAKQQALTRRLIGPARDADLEKRMAELNVPVMVVFGTLDRLMPPEMGRHYREILPDCHLMFVYDAAHEADADRPEAFTAIASDFLERHDGFLVSRESSLIYR